MSDKKKALLSEFNLSNEQRLEIQNLALREQLLAERSTALQRAHADLIAERKLWGARVEEDKAVNLDSYTINADTGVCTLKEKG